MTNKSIIYFEDSKRKIINIAPNLLGKGDDNATINQIANQLVPNGVSWEAIDSNTIPVDLQEAKDKKIAEIKTKRNQENIKPITNATVTTAPLLKEDVSGLVLDGTKTVNFNFNMAPTSNSFTDPTTILTEVITQDSTTDYSTTKVSDGSKCYVRLDKTIAENIKNHAKVRMLNNIYFTNKIEDAIEACTTVAQVEAIDWDTFTL
jgi:hypothetical protein